MHTGYLNRLLALSSSSNDSTYRPFLVALGRILHLPVFAALAFPFFAANAAVASTLSTAGTLLAVILELARVPAESSVRGLRDGGIGGVEGGSGGRTTLDAASASVALV